MHRPPAKIVRNRVSGGAFISSHISPGGDFLTGGIYFATPATRRYTPAPAVRRLSRLTVGRLATALYKMKPFLTEC